MRLLRTAAIASNEASSAAEAMRICIEEICGYTGWALGHAYACRLEGNAEAVPTGVCYVDGSERFEPFLAVTAGTRFPSGVGLPGRVLLSGEAAWITDLAADPNFPRAVQAQRCGIAAGLAFPVLIGTEVAAVLEFFSLEAERPREDLIDVMRQVGVQLGRVIERERAAETLRRSEARYRAVVEAAPDAIVTMSTDGVIRSFNRGGERTFGYGEHEVVGRPLRMLMPERFRGAHEVGFRRYLKGGEARVVGMGPVELAGLRKGGEEFPIELSVGKAGEGKDTLFTGVIRDITERKRMEAELNREHEFRAAILESLNEGVVACDAASSLMLFNQAARNFHGAVEQKLGPDEWAARYDLLLADGRTPMRKEDVPLFRAYNGETVRDAEMVIAPAKGPKRTLLANGQAIHDADGNKLGAVVAMQDVTERKRVEEKLKHLNEELEKRNLELGHKNQEIEAFVYSVSHDLRSPLVNLEGFSEELALVGQDLREILEDSAVPPEVRRQGLALVDEDMATSIHFIRTGVRRLSNIIDALLRLSRAGRVEYQWQKVDLNPIAERVVEAMKGTVTERGAKVEMDRLPPVWGDAGQLEQVLANLVGNALNYLDPGRPGLIEVGCGMPDAADDRGPDLPGFNTYYVRDNGIGVPAQSLHKVFQVFQRLHPKLSGGEGIGLTLVQHIVQRHGGKIWIESTEGQGSTFFVRLPSERGGNGS